MEVAAERSLALAVLDDLAEDVQVVGDLLLREEAHELEAVPQLDLGDDGQGAVAAEGLEVVADGDAHPLVGAAHVGQVALERLQVVPRVLAEDRDEDVFLAVEVEVDRAVSDARGLGDLRDFGVEVAVLAKTSMAARRMRSRLLVPLKASEPVVVGGGAVLAAAIAE